MNTYKNIIEQFITLRAFAKPSRPLRFNERIFLTAEYAKENAE